MNFGGSRARYDDLEINLIPMIDVLLVMLIFLAASSTFVRQTQLRVDLPQAQSEQTTPSSNLEISVSSDGRYALNGVLITAPDTAAIAQALRQAVGETPHPVLTVNADGQATHQSVVNVMEAARLAGIARVNFAAQTAP
jgi:biopolymer transport protein ExbD